MRQLRYFFLVSGILALILGFRIFIGIRFVAAIPQNDDWATVLWLQNWSQGIHDWSFIWQRHNGHLLVLYNLLNLDQYLLNGYWDGHLDFLAFAFIRTAYAALVIFTFANILTPLDRWWILTLIFILFAVPFAGFRMAWGNIWPHCTMMLFSLWALYRTVYDGQKWTDVIFVSLLAALASVNMASGCLGALMVVLFILLRAAVTRRMTGRNGVLLMICLAIFLACYLTGPKQVGVGFLEGCNAFFKALAWPAVFIPGAGTLSLIPLIGLVAAYIAVPSFRSRNHEYVIAAGGLVFLVAVATGAFRGEANIMGMPSARYTDIFIMLPLVCAVALCFLYRGSSRRYKVGWAVFGSIWLCVQVLAFSIHFFYHVLPFLTLESGEWNEPYKQVLFRDLVRGTTSPPADHPIDIDIDFPSPQMFDVIKGRMTMPAMTLPMLTGFPLKPGSEGDYLPGGYHPSYQPRPMQFYWGSYDRENPYAVGKWFLSGPFRPQADYITIDLLVDKRARFSNYRLDGLHLALVDENTGQKRDLLPLLAHSFPYIFRDWEMVYAKVIPGHDYRILSSDTNPNAKQWIAFGEPFESGKLTPLIVIVSQSGKLLCLVGIFFLMLVYGFDNIEKFRRSP